VARLLAKKRYRKEFTGVILAVTSNHRTERYGISEGNREPRKKRGRADRVRKRLRSGGGLAGVVQLNLFDLVKSL